MTHPRKTSAERMLQIIKPPPSYPPAGDGSGTAILVRTRLRSRRPDLLLLR